MPARPSAIRASIPVVTAAARVLSPPSMPIPAELRWPRAHRRRLVLPVWCGHVPVGLPRVRRFPVRSWPTPAPIAGGSGRTRVTSEQTIEFPAGTHDGDEVRISGMGHAGTNGAAGGDLVGRAHVESERLEGKARTGFYLMGIVAPFLVLSAISGVFSAFAVMCFIPFTMGLFMVLSDGVLHRSLLWWKRGAMQFANGFANGFMFALVSVWFASCSQRAMLSPYGMQ